jgi:amidohydrolase
MNMNERAAKYADYIVEMRRAFHQIPEVSMEEYETSAKVKEELDKMGVSWRPCGGETGVLATIGGKKPGKCVLLRADMDGLTVNEETGYDFASRHEGMMHACGHDAHIATLLTAAKILKDMEDDLNGTVKLAFQPGEEVAKGCKAMIADGALEGVDGCYSCHVWATVDSGVYNCEPGPRMASAGMFVIDVKGKSGHGSAPHEGIDCAVAASAIVNNLQSIVSREMNPMEPVVVTVGRMEVGTRWNVIAGSAKIEGTTRTFDKEIFTRLPEIIERIAKDTASAYRAEVKCDFVDLTTPVVNDPKVAEIAAKAAEKIVGKENVRTFDKITGGEDFCFFMNEVPGAQAFMGIRNPEIGATYPNHDGHFKVDESVLIQNAAIAAQFAVDFLNQ